jgi:hypothetical protein
MSHHTATLERTSQTITTLCDASLAISDLLYWVDDEYFQPFVKWAAPRLQDAAVTALVWTVVFVIRFCLWLMETIEQWAATDAIAIDMSAWAQAYAPAEDVLAIAPAADPVVVCPGDGWECWISRQLSHTLLLPSVGMAIAATDDQGNETDTAIDPWTSTSNWEYSELSPAVFPVAVQPKRAIALLPPAKSSMLLGNSPSKGRSQSPKQTTQKPTSRGKSKPRGKGTQKTAQPSRRTNR